MSNIQCGAEQNGLDWSRGGGYTARNESGSEQAGCDRCPMGVSRAERDRALHAGIAEATGENRRGIPLRGAGAGRGAARIHRTGSGVGGAGERRVRGAAAWAVFGAGAVRGGAVAAGAADRRVPLDELHGAAAGVSAAQAACDEVRLQRPRFDSAGASGIHAEGAEDAVFPGLQGADARDRAADGRGGDGERIGEGRHRVAAGGAGGAHHGGAGRGRRAI